MFTISQPLRNDENIVNISRTEKTPYFYMLVDYGDCYMCLRSNRRDYALDIVKTIGKDEISPEEAETLLDEGRKFFEHADKAVQKYLEKYGIE
ncbi:hypothetical protein [Bacillus yapensis]|uniref:hypothetical protein n=1 Tax=Bacillus yapensis TaxID=2492960 RepID=UPI001484D584|nr:hypothetical protein [Bacillus yapensis]